MNSADTEAQESGHTSEPPPRIKSGPVENQAQLWTDPALFDIYQRQRQQTSPAVRVLVEKTIKKYLGEAPPKILEIGSGRGYLMDMLPEKIRSNIIQSDRVAGHLQHNPFDTSKIVADAYNLPFQNREMAGIVSFAVLDTFSELDRALQEFYRVLKPNGIMIGFLDLLPSHEPMMNRFSDEILFPAALNVPGNDILACRGFLRVKIKDLQRQINNNRSKLHDALITAIELYSSDPIRQYPLIQNDQQWLEICRMFKDVLNVLDVHYTEIDQLALFKDILEQAVTRNNFQIVESNIQTANLEIDKNSIREIPSGKNVVYFHTGSRWFGYDPNVSEEKIKVVASIYVIVVTRSSTPLRSKLQRHKGPKERQVGI